MSVERGPSARIIQVEEDEFIKLAQKQNKLGIFGIDDLTEGEARDFKLKRMVQELEKYDRGWEGNSRKCPKCGKLQVYKGDAPRKIRVSGGTIEIDRAYYVCKECKHSSFPLDEMLSLAPEMEQGRLREKIAILGGLISYHQIPELSQQLLGIDISAASVRRLLLMEAALILEECPVKELTPSNEDTLYLQVDGVMCPTRDKRKDTEDQGFREAKVATSFTSGDCAEVSRNRVEILDQLIEAKICNVEEFKPILEDLYKRSNSKLAKQTVVLSDGAKWIQNLCKSIAPNAIQILDYTHAKQHLYSFAKLKFGENNSEVFPFIKEMKELLWNDKAGEVAQKMLGLAGDDKMLLREANFFKNNKRRMLYKTFQDKGLHVGSGAIESLAKRLTQGRIKGAGMRWNVKDVNPVLMFRAALFDKRLKAHSRYQREMEVEYFQKLAA